MTKTAEEIRAEFWKIQARVKKFSSTVDRELDLALLEMMSECAAQLAETNELLRRTVGLVNVEKLALDLGRVVNTPPGGVVLTPEEAKKEGVTPPSPDGTGGWRKK